MLYYFKNFLATFVIITGVIGLFFLRKEKKTFWKAFPFVLILIGILDKIGGFIFKTNPNFANYYFILLLVPLNFIFYFWLLDKFIKSNGRLFILGTALYLISLAIEVWVNWGKETFYFASYSYSVANFILLTLALRFFYQLSTSNRILEFYNERAFWVALGLLIFWLGSLPYYGLFNYLYKTNTTFFNSYYPFVLGFDYFMYVCFIIAFVWAKRT